MCVPLHELGLVAAETRAGDVANNARTSSDSPPRAWSKAPPIRYLHIYEDANISLGIFCLPANAQIPLHNHPGMTVLSRVLYGTMHVRSFDWRADAGGGKPSNGREALPVYDQAFTAGDAPVVLFPTSGGNIHQFTALTDCAVLDLLSPPYSTDDGRDCTYYQQVPGGTDGVVVLQAFDPPADFVISSGVYRGLKVGPNTSGLDEGERSGNSTEDSGSPGSTSPRSVSPTLGGHSPPGINPDEEDAVRLANKFKQSTLNGNIKKPVDAAGGM